MNNSARTILSRIITLFVAVLLVATAGGCATAQSQPQPRGWSRAEGARDPATRRTNGRQPLNCTGVMPVQRLKACLKLAASLKPSASAMSSVLRYELFR